MLDISTFFSGPTRLYKSVDDYDVVRGIFSSKFGTKDVTSQAVDAEMRGDFQTAMRKYTEVGFARLSQTYAYS